MKKLEGVVPILPTPFAADDTIDVAQIRELVDFARRAGVAAVGTPAFGSEFYKLDGTERTLILETVIDCAAGRLPVIAQCNHTSPRIAARLAAEAEKLGASAINTALPRAFASSPRQLVEYARTVCDASSLPVIVQDWNPGGAAMGAPFAAELHAHCANFRYLKLEEPGIGPVIRAVRETTGGAIGVFVGWGGLHVPELQPAGACGVMPGLGLVDVMARIWQMGRDGREADMMELFAKIMPYLQFSLQTFEQFHHAEKRLLCARGILRSPSVRAVTLDLNDDASRYLDRLITHLRSSLSL